MRPACCPMPFQRPEVSHLADTSVRVALGGADVHVWLARTDACVRAGLMPQYLSLLTADERQRLARLAFEDLKHEFLLTRALCRVALSSYTDRHPGTWVFASNAYGRPSLPPDDPAAHLSFNLSNTCGLVACAVASGRPIGIDVEDAARHHEGEKIAERFFSPDEVRALRALPSVERHERFIQLWTLKEAYIKAKGLGMTLPLDSFSFSCGAQQASIVFHDVDQGDPGLWRFRAWRVDERHRAALAVKCASAGEQIAFRISEVMPAVHRGRWGLLCRDTPEHCGVAGKAAMDEAMAQPASEAKAPTWYSWTRGT